MQFVYCVIYLDVTRARYPHLVLNSAMLISTIALSLTNVKKEKEPNLVGAPMWSLQPRYFPNILLLLKRRCASQLRFNKVDDVPSVIANSFP